MAFDPYGPCPCGLDKKLKFCCNDVAGDMEKVARLQDGGQTQRALEELDLLAEKHPANPWVQTALAAQLLDVGDAQRARDTLHGVLKKSPDQPYALALLAALVFAIEGYEGAKPVFHRAMQKCSSSYPNMLARIALGIAEEAFGNQKYLCSREHLALALRLAQGEEGQREVFMQLLEFEGNGEVPYPLRSVHAFVDLEGTEEQNEQHTLAAKLSYLGLWAEAAGVLQKLADELPEHPGVRRNLGFCHAWDGNLTAAAEHLHRAAELAEDFETAVELETIAQLHDLDTTEDRVRVMTAEYAVPPLSGVLSELDDVDRLVRVELPPEQLEEGLLSAVYYVLDRSPGDEPMSSEADVDDVPEVLGQLLLFDAHAEAELPPRVTLTGREGDSFDAVQSLFVETLGDRAEPRESEHGPTETLPTELQVLSWRWFFPPKTPVAVQRELEQRKWREVLDETWPATPLGGLDGKSPAEVKGDEASRVKLAAAIQTLDAHCNANQYELDLAEMRSRFGLPEVASFEVADDQPINAVSSMQLARIAIGGQSDARLAELVNRALLIRQNAFLRRLLTEVLDRPSCRETVDLDRCHQTLADLERNRFDVPAALAWIKAGAEVSTGGEEFERKLSWKLRELRYRIELPEDPELPPLLEHLWNYFGSKLPQLREHLDETARAAGIDPPWGSGGLITSATTTTGEGGLWTPGSPEEPPAEGGESKLWVPGQ